ncbi:MAG: alpha/beta fold hydrolase [Chloroflexi bacterium]|nr:alpha/beta fold hydrolase [Chloroflexota bacterium]MBV9897523.1 alpha/beta fold hydrolase [Chloroflexota bacterium]
MAKLSPVVSGQYLDVPGARLYYETAGDGPPVVFLHGFSLDARMWDDQWDAFASRHRVVRYDLRGFGRSEAQPVAYSQEDDLVALLDHLEIARAHVIGLSMGGVYAVDFALAHPERVLGLVPVDGAASGSLGPMPPGPALAEAQAAEGRTDEALTSWLADPFFTPAHEQPGVAVRLREIVSGYGWWAARHPGKRRRIHPPAAGRLGEITAPTLVVVGERDVPRLRETSDELARGIPGARLLVLPGAGHMANMEAPQAFNTAVLNFLASQVVA